MSALDHQQCFPFHFI